MKKKLKLVDFTNNPLNVEELSKLKGGFGGISPFDVGCRSFVCTSSRDTSSAECQPRKCSGTACDSGA